MSRIARTLLLLCTCAPLATAQNERRPENYQIAIGLQQRGLHDEAAGYLEAFVGESPKHPLVAEAFYRLAQSRIELRREDQAIAALEEAVARGGASFALRPEALYRLGNLHQDKGEHEPALQNYRLLGESIAADHYLAAAQSYAEGETLRELGRDDEAEPAFARAAERATGEQQGFLFPARYQQGFAALRQQRFEPAAVAFAQASKAAPDDAARAECAYLIGDARLRLEQYDAAQQAFEAARRIGGEFADDAVFGLGWVALGRGDRAAAIEAFGALLKEHPQSPFVGTARLERGRCFYQEQRYDDAMQMLQPLLQDGNELQQDARELEGLCALASGAGKAAIESLQRAIAAADEADRPRLWFALGEAHATQQQWQPAVEAYGEVDAAAGADLHGDALYGACHALHELGAYERSLALAEQVLAFEPPHRTASLARLAQAENRFALQQYEQAEPIYAQLEQKPEHARIARWKLAWCRYLRGDKQAAAQRFEAIAASDDEANAEEALAMQALALYECERGDEALQVADRYRARHRDGQFLARTERIAARVLQKRGDLAAAQRRLARAAAIASQRDDGEAAAGDVVEQADLCYRQGDFEQAEQLYAQLSDRRDAIGARAVAGRAWCAFELGDDDACLQRIASAQQHPEAEAELAGLLELESAVQHRRQAWPEAVTAARTFLQRFAQHDKAPTMQYALGVALARAGRHGDAREVLAALAAADSYRPQDRVLYELAWACRRDGDEPAALANFRKVAQTSEDVELAAEARLFVGTAMLEGERPDLAEATRWLEAVQGSYRKQALYRLGFAEFEAAGEDAARLASARDHFGAIAALDGEELLAEALFLGAECCRRLGDAKGAVERAGRLLRQAPEHERAARARLLLGECSLLAGAPADAIAPLERFLREHDADTDDVARADAARANLWLGRARLAQKQHEQAEACLQRVTELSSGPLAAEAQFRLGEGRRDRGDLNGAVDAFVKLPILYAEAEWVRRGLLAAGQTYDRLRQPDKAERFYRELVDKHGDSAEAATARTELQQREGR